MRGILILAVTSIFLMAMFGCSGSSEVVIPEDNRAAFESGDNHGLWGLWQFTADIENEILDVVPLRLGEMHLNALKFLEPPVNLYLTVENIQFTGQTIDLDVVLRHPFLGLNQYTGFDVCGILISYGSVTGFDDADMAMPGDGDTRLLNPDGYMRWWNPVEFPHTDTMFGYKDGLLGTPDDIAEYTATLNGYKFFCDDITTPDDPLSSVDPASRCVFSAGQSNTRHYTIEIAPDGLVFNYAVDANWKYPVGSPPWSVPDDFGPQANRTEAWNIAIATTENTLWNDGIGSGGDLSLSIDVWDHFDADLNTVRVESPGNFAITSSVTPVDGGDGYSTYEIDIMDATPAEESIDLLITVESEAVDYQDLLPGKKVSAYFTHSVDVDDEEPVQTDCGTAIHGELIPSPFIDQPDTVSKNEIANLISGPYAGEMLVQSAPNSVNRYDMDAIGPHSGNHFLDIPPAAQGDFNIIYHLDIDPIDGKVIVVPSGLGHNNSMLVYDDEGNLLSPDTGISVGPDRKIYAIHPNDNGELWILTTGHSSFSTSYESRLERWLYSPVTPYYTHIPGSDLDTDEILGEDPGSGVYKVGNDITEMTISWAKQRIFILQQAHIGEHNGRLYVFDINETGPPTYREDLSIMSLFSQGTWRSFYDNQRGSNGGLYCDHSNEILDECRIIIYGRSHPDMDIMLIRLDGDANILNETLYVDSYAPSSMGITWPTPMHEGHLMLVDYNPDRCSMSAAPGDW